MRLLEALHFAEGSIGDSLHAMVLAEDSWVGFDPAEPQSNCIAVLLAYLLSLEGRRSERC